MPDQPRSERSTISPASSTKVSTGMKQTERGNGASAPDDIPRNSEDLQVHLSLDQPSGRRVTYLRDYYAHHPAWVTDAHACIDLCNEYLEFTDMGCWTCGADARDQECSGEVAVGLVEDLVGRHCQQLTPQMTGVWVVETRGSKHTWDLDNMTYTRAGASSGADAMLFDGNAMPITQVEAWPKVGEPFGVWFADPDDPNHGEHYRPAPTVHRIWPLAPLPTDSREATGNHDEG